MSYPVPPPLPSEPEPPPVIMVRRPAAKQRRPVMNLHGWLGWAMFGATVAWLLVIVALMGSILVPALLEYDPRNKDAAALVIINVRLAIMLGIGCPSSIYAVVMVVLGVTRIAVK